MLNTQYLKFYYLYSNCPYYYSVNKTPFPILSSTIVYSPSASCIKEKEMRVREREGMRMIERNDELRRWQGRERV